ncbi:TetR family transcriptional regulator [Paenibacillus kribbensis]|uniref:TetR family transcriptional regulator n=1 Tax=Paenibacillus kribbensis TaxID=172713 RepID=A0A222WNJ7_9BACL|nr:TetR/AcrR family transcriptional regulator [Paenibacillus kribbensis]ASR47494.1 TetR family transcriptional regulator [Paenibacillus kribbensis]
MTENKTTEMQRLEILRLSNAESNRITKTCIESAMILLMKDKCFHDISITDIVKRAGVSRTAYYRNYDSKEDILRSVMKEIVDKVIVAMNLRLPIQNTYDYWYSLFHMLQQHADSLKILLMANFGDAILNEIHSIMQSSVSKNSIQENYKSYFWSGAIYSVAASWIRDGMQQTAEEMAKICYQIIDHMNEDCHSTQKE